MDFSLTAEQQMFREMFYDFAEREVAKVADQIDKKEELPPRLIQKMAAQGFFGAIAPEEPYGGAALDTTSYMLLLQALASECSSTALTIHVHNSLALRAILRFGSEALREELLPDVVSGQRIGAYAMSEANAGSDPTYMRTRAVRDGDEYVLNGVKTWVSNGGLAGVYVVFAVTDAAANGRGMSAFVVPADTPGLEVGGRESTLGLRGACITRLYLNDCRVPATNLLGEEGQGYKIGLEILDFGRTGVSAAAVGAARRALELGAKFATERVQFGKPIAQKQAIQVFLADAATAIDAGEALMFKAAWLADQGKRFTQQAAMAKLFCSRMVAQVTDNMLQIYGGAGFILDYPIERYYRDARALEILEGTSQIQQVIIAGNVLSEYGVKIRP